jgi:diguanylate cyclase (GGDEF)-like protein
MAKPAFRTDTVGVQDVTELRAQLARVLEHQATPIENDAVAVFPYAGVEAGAGESNTRLAELILRLLALGSRDGDIDHRHDDIGELRQISMDRGLGVKQVYGLVYLVERAALDELALDESIGATSEPWPALAQIVRRASFDLLAAYAERLTRESGEGGLIDPLTTLHTRAVLEAALEKEIQRAERFGHPLALILVDIDRLAEINARHGYGSGDRVLERVGILMRNYFREQDWVARLSGDAFAVLLPGTNREHAELLAERVRTTVESRMALHDYRSEEELPVTVSVAAVFVETVETTMHAERILDEARQAVQRAKLAGRNRVETVDISSARPLAPPRENPLG